MTYRVEAFDHFGKYRENRAFASFHELSVRAYAIFHHHVGTAEARPFTDLVRKMVYVAEATSVALRLNASWALTHPAFSLCRDRYEQCARFSWLARQTDDREWHRYIADKYFREARLKKAFAARGVDIPELDTRAFDELPDEKKKSFRHWDNLKLDRLADGRDKLKGITGSKLDQELFAGSTIAFIDRGAPYPITIFIRSTCSGCMQVQRVLFWRLTPRFRSLQSSTAQSSI